MRKFWLHIALSCLCLTCLAGCGNSGYDRRLVDADSLMAVSPDSARAVLRAIDADRLSRADRAYHALLSTQAAYKCFDSIPSTATIDRAVDYFSSGSDREKLTRSLIYKGAVIEDLGNKTEAIRLYKLAEAEADTSDYFNLGYVNLRMASLYRDSYIGNQTDVKKYMKSYRFYTLAGLKKYQLKCIYNIGAQYRITDLDSAYKYINKSIELSREIGDSATMYDCLLDLAEAYYIDRQVHKAVIICRKILIDRANYADRNIYHCLCRSYLQLNKFDSAYYYEAFLDKNFKSNFSSQVKLHNTLSALCESRGDYKKSLIHRKAAESLADSLDRTSPKVELIDVEAMFNQQLELRKEYQSTKRTLTLITFIAILVVALAILTFIVVSKIKKNRELSCNIQNIYEDLCASTKKIENNICEKQELNDVLSKHFDFIKQILDSSYRNSGNSKKFVNDFLEIFNANRLSDTIWSNMQDYVNKRYNNILSRLKNQCPSLTENELNFITMICLDFSYIQITVCMGYTNYKYISTKKIRIEKKLGIRIKLNEYINQMKQI